MLADTDPDLLEWIMRVRTDSNDGRLFAVDIVLSKLSCRSGISLMLEVDVCRLDLMYDGF